ncbi:uncharacterized protein [Coffea arabica]|uniref:Rieske domain-containing protein n=1 Tax=Coffea arabica TaxID=13443 RepID=A0ABM4W732_COFAR
MSLIQAGSLVYPVGGVKGNEEERHLYEPGSLPREFSCISLSTPLENSRAEIKCPMHGAKYFPLIEEIDGRIYVLSGPLPSYGSLDIVDIGFEVYYPLEDRWVDLSIPPFLKKDKTDGCAEDLTIVTFKLLSERGGDGALSCALISTRTCNAIENGSTVRPIYSFILRVN